MTTCKDFALGIGMDQAKTMGIPLTDEPLEQWRLKKDNATLRAQVQKAEELLKRMKPCLYESGWIGCCELIDAYFVEKNK